MAQDLSRLLERDQQLDQEKAEIARSRHQIADEYLVKARLWTTFYDQPQRFEQACEYFDTALEAARTPTALFEYAVFLQNHNCFEPATVLYSEVLTSHRQLAQENPRAYLPDVAMTLNNLAILQADQNQLSAAQASYEEALGIRRQLAQENPRAYLPDVAMTLLNLSIFYLQAVPERQTSTALAREVLAISQEFPGIPRVAAYAATARRVLAAHGD
ncbi:TPR repeat family protein [Halomicronema hongdechloris C2206]|uniref:TPR repeat family protein n=1 Tax=Halomicronema hongdechloris C2206 TaxID=1641165 RepID=A0A1Z3HNR4_9CYAN|nr:tetratricopeptide repeat protein [Halomicronema hongdechloris]ASC71807.1 TPR repeat family protein [Halomicronema hongdechloris C2206]